VNKYVLSFLFLLVATVVWGQGKSKVVLVSSTVAERAAGPNGTNILKVRNGVFKQDYSTLTSDSAYFYPDQNMVDAFSHVVINQGDTVHIYSDKLNYDGNTKIAILTNHVIMVDKATTLTTDNFTYNTATRIGTYTDGGKIVNKDNVLVSKNGYYFSFTKDAYFRYDVVCTTPSAVIKTDTMRYNSGSRIAYFYGPTIITGKDKDNLYTENGFYNTATEQAYFGKKNLYTQKTKSLKGDSLFYDRKKGYGRATNHVTFNDSEQRITIKGDLGEYYKADEQAVVTRNAYMIFVTEDSSGVKKDPEKKTGIDTLLKNKKVTGTDTLTKKMTDLTRSLSTDKKLTLQGITDSVTKKLPAGAKQLTPANKTIVKAATDSIAKHMPTIKKAVQQNKNITVAGAVNALTKAAAQTGGKPLVSQKVIPQMNPIVYKYADTVKEAFKPRPGIKYDSLYFVADTLKTRILTYKDLKTLQQQQYDAAHRDTSIKIKKRAAPIVYKTSPKFLTTEPMPFHIDTTSTADPNLFGKPKPPVVKVQPKVAKVIVVPKRTEQDSLRDKQKADSLALHMPKPLSDTSRIRIVSGYNNSKLFKSDLQAKADSMFYSTVDSTIHMYVNPMIWTQGSQLSGDTIHLQMKHKTLDNLEMAPHAFIVNLEKSDSTFFNQAGGKRMHGEFKNGKLSKFVIIGNAETIYFKRDSVKNIVTDMSRTVSGKAYFTFDKGEIISNAFVSKYEARGLPIAKVKDEDKILKGFIWKPKERPISKEAVLSGYYKKPATTKPGAKAGMPTIKNGKNGISKPGNLKAAKDSLSNTPATIKLGKDSVSKAPVNIKLGKDSLSSKPNIPAIKKMSKDSVTKDTSAQRRSTILKPGK
jgi:lipopolysaccharide export system protein LptA